MGEARCLRCLGVRLVVEAELVEVGRRAVAVEVDCVLGTLVAYERVAVERDERGREHRPHELPHGDAQRAFAAWSASRSFRAMLSDPSALVRVTAAG